eukprot:7010165-Prymnesium_polylepis.3
MSMRTFEIRSNYKQGVAQEVVGAQGCDVIDRKTRQTDYHRHKLRRERSGGALGDVSHLLVQVASWSLAPLAL